MSTQKGEEEGSADPDSEETVAQVSEIRQKKSLVIFTYEHSPEFLYWYGKQSEGMNLRGYMICELWYSAMPVV